MSVTVGDVLRVVAVLTWLDGEVMQNVFNATIGGSGGPYDEDDIVDDALAWLGDMYANLVTVQSDEVDGSEVRVYVYDAVDDDWDEIGSDAWTYNPTTASEQTARGVSGLINAKTTDPDVNGKKYVGGLTEGGLTDGVINAATLAQLALFAADWLTAFTGGTSGADWVPGIWSPTRTNFLAASGTLLIPAIPAYQRRRKQGVGI
jgi:hypothetical protein